LSGGATAALLRVFFLLPISVAFQDRPALTAIIGTVTALGYLAVWIFYSERDDKVGLPNMVYTPCRLSALVGRRGDRAVLRARPSVRAGEGAAGDTPSTAFGGNAIRRASQPRSRRAPS
jgi:hypothetical protein